MFLQGLREAKLQQSCIIDDVLGEGEQLYQIERVIRKSGNLFKDGSHILYFNTARQDDNALGKLAKDLKEANPKEISSGGRHGTGRESSSFFGWSIT